MGTDQCINVGLGTTKNLEGERADTRTNAMGPTCWLLGWGRSLHYWVCPAIKSLTKSLKGFARWCSDHQWVRSWHLHECLLLSFQALVLCCLELYFSAHAVWVYGCCVHTFFFTSILFPQLQLMQHSALGSKWTPSPTLPNSYWVPNKGNCWTPSGNCPSSVQPLGGQNR